MKSLFDKKYVHFMWEDELEGKKGFFADGISDLKGNVEMSGEADPFKSLHNIIVYSPSDFSKTIEMAWIYGIVVGWDDDECFEEFEKKFTCWSKNDSKRLKELHENFVKVSKENGIVWHDLRKDPNDLPKKAGNYIVRYLDDTNKIHSFELSYVDYLEAGHWIDEDNHNIEYYDKGVIEWCEIPQ